MSISNIAANFMDRTVIVQERANTINSKGSPTEVWSNVLTNIPGTRQPIRQEEIKGLPQGNLFKITDKYYLNYDETSGVPIVPQMRIIDNFDGLVFRVVSVLRYKSARTAINFGHHLKIFVELIPTDSA